jgi:hypothetical protein
MDQPPASLLRQFLQAYLAAQAAAAAGDAEVQAAPAPPPGQAVEGQARKPRVVAVFDDEDGQG